MYFINKIFIVLIFLLLSVNFCFCEEKNVNRLISGHEIWRYLNYFDREDYIKQQKTIFARKYEVPNDIVGLNGLFFNCYEQGKFITDVLRITSKENDDVQVKFLLNQLIIKENDISGYKSLNEKKIEIHRFENHDERKYRYGTMQFSVVPEQWSENLDLSGRYHEEYQSKYDVSINVKFSFLPSDEKICVYIIRAITASSNRRENLLNFYRLDKGPGDVCLVQVKSSEGNGNFYAAYNPEKNYVWNDLRVIFIRSNILVYLTSSYKNFGCMDLACRLDALIVEQMKKQQEKTDVKQPSNGKRTKIFYRTLGDIATQLLMSRLYYEENKTTSIGTAPTTDTTTFYTVLDVPNGPWNVADTTTPDTNDVTKTIPKDDKIQPWITALEFAIQTANTKGQSTPATALGQLTTFLHAQDDPTTTDVIEGHGMTYDTTNGASGFGLSSGKRISTH
jgi:hypothetical protein